MRPSSSACSPLAALTKAALAASGAALAGTALDYPPKQRQHAHWPGPCINTALILQGAPGLSKL